MKDKFTFDDDVNTNENSQERVINSTSKGEDGATYVVSASVPKKERPQNADRIHFRAALREDNDHFAKKERYLANKMKEALDIDDPANWKSVPVTPRKPVKEEEEENIWQDDEEDQKLTSLIDSWKNLIKKSPVQPKASPELDSMFDKETTKEEAKVATKRRPN